MTDVFFMKNKQFMQNMPQKHNKRRWGILKTVLTLKALLEALTTNSDKKVETSYN